MNRENILLVGGFHEIVEACEACEKTIVGVIENDRQGVFMTFPIVGGDVDAARLRQEYADAKVFLTPDGTRARRTLFAIYDQAGFQLATIVHPKANISATASIGAGALVQCLANVSSNVTTGLCTRINSAANVMHDVVLGDFVTIGPNAVLLGRVQVAGGVYIGANATILPGVHIGADATVGAGSVVTKDVEPNTTVYGNPARPRGA